MSNVITVEDLTTEVKNLISDYTENMADANACYRALETIYSEQNTSPLIALLDAHALYYHEAQQALEELEKLGYKSDTVLLLACKLAEAEEKEG